MRMCAPILFLSTSVVSAAAFSPTFLHHHKTPTHLHSSSRSATTREIHGGCGTYPPMIETPAPSSTGLDLLVQPPDTDTLWEWYIHTRNDINADPSWGRIWPTAASLSRYIHNDDGDSIVRGKHCVELGCGLGVAGLTAAVCGAKTVTLCDREGYALQCAMSSAALNGIPTDAVGSFNDNGDDNDDDVVVVRAALDDWEKDPPTLEMNVDVVLASDVLYDVNHVQGLVDRARGLLGENGGGLFLVADPDGGRAKGCREAFLEYAKKTGATRVEVQELPQPISPERCDLDIDGLLAKVVLLIVEWS